MDKNTAKILREFAVIIGFGLGSAAVAREMAADITGLDAESLSKKKGPLTHYEKAGVNLLVAWSEFTKAKELKLIEDAEKKLLVEKNNLLGAGGKE